MYKLLIFDVDGTLADMKTGELLPGVAEFFEMMPEWEERYAIATNQGGVALRYWMETDGFGEPAVFPTEEAARAHVDGVVGKIGREFDVHICFAYQSKRTGKWAPMPSSGPEWEAENRKPNPGMLLAAMEAAGVTYGRDVLMIGDGDEDELAALRAGVTFVHADVFFERGGGSTS
ncbi:MAG: HAD hydrolase-like protein [Caldilineaceae bacterium]|nr:HAD hydrolase-like protein [Caldilineaceae bacterium]